MNAPRPNPFQIQPVQPQNLFALRPMPPFERTEVDSFRVRIRVGEGENAKTVEYGYNNGVWMWRSIVGNDTDWHLLSERRYTANAGDAAQIHNTIASYLDVINREGRVPEINGVDGMEIYLQGGQLRGTGLITGNTPRRRGADLLGGLNLQSLVPPVQPGSSDY